MGDLSKNFSRKEFACQGTDCCEHSSPIGSKLIQVVQMLRDEVARPLKITSGYRCNKHNRLLDAKSKADKSLHCYGMAADIACPAGMDLMTFAKLAEKCLDKAGIEGGLGVYPNRNFIHVDVRFTRWRDWNRA